MGIIEQIIRPFVDVDVTPTPYVQPGTVGVPPAIVQVGMQGGTQIFTGDASYTRATKLGAVHAETAPSSETIQKTLG